MSSLTLWVTIGFIGQFIFGSRFVVQWIASERRKESFIPMAFWYLSIAGSIILLAYAIHRRDPVFITGQCTGFLIYFRNLSLIFKKKNGNKLSIRQHS
ncbi:MAG: lipid-A-disaccharide synthase N-terminal domain-containing protein [Candidatus Anammoxibacter sp.]